MSRGVFREFFFCWGRIDKVSGTQLPEFFQLLLPACYDFFSWDPCVDLFAHPIRTGQFVDPVVTPPLKVIRIQSPGLLNDRQSRPYRGKNIGILYMHLNPTYCLPFVFRESGIEIGFPKGDTGQAGLGRGPQPVPIL